MTTLSFLTRRTLRFGLAILLLSALGLSNAFADEEGLYIETLNRTSGLTGEQPTEELSKTYVAYGKMKVVNEGPQGSDMIIDPSTGNMTFLNHATKEYYQINAKSMADSMSQPGLEQMRAMMEQTKVKVEPTGQSKEINGWNCTEYKVTKTGMIEVKQEVWATQDVDIDLTPYTRLTSMSGPDGLLGDSAAGQAQRAEMDKIKGYPILTQSNMQMMGSTMEAESEVKVIRKEPMSAEFFEIPKDYTKKDMGSAAHAPDGAHP